MTAADELPLLRPVLELAWVVARVGEQQHPRLPAPRPMKPFLRFARLPDRALDATRRAIDTDEGFRTRLLPGADESAVGRAGFLFLTRPEGWEEELSALAATAAAAEQEEQDEQEERAARRRLPGVEDARRRADEARAAALADAARVAAELEDERQARRRTEEALAEAAALVERLRAEAGSFRSAADRSRRQRDELAAELERLQADLAAVLAEPPVPPPAVAPPVAPPAVVPAPAPAPQPVPPLPEPPTSRIDVDALAAALAAAATAFRSLGDALGAAAGAIDPAEPAEPVSPRAGGAEPASVITRPAPPPAPAARRAPPARRRVPVALPPAVFDDAPEATDFLVRLNGVVLLVDGYNVSKLRWGQLPVPDQRHRLIHALGELAARTGADVHVVFDGVDQIEPPPPPERRRLVRVTFSPTDVEADDVIVGMVDGVPLHRPVVVASSDRRVQTESAQLGANIISSQQLLDALGR